MPFIDTSALEVIERLPGWYGRYFHSPSVNAIQARAPESMSETQDVHDFVLSKTNEFSSILLGDPVVAKQAHSGSGSDATSGKERPCFGCFW
jgi:hypothetical protein